MSYSPVTGASVTPSPSAVPPNVAPPGVPASKPTHVPAKPSPDRSASKPSEPPATPTSAKPAPSQTRPVLHVVNGEHYSGAERVQDLLALALPEFGYDAGFASLKPGLFGDHRRSVAAPLCEVEMHGKWDFGAAWRVAEFARDGEYELLHAHTPRSLVIANVVSRLTGLPLVSHVHSPASRDSTRRLANWMNDRAERLCMSRVEKLITVSPTLSEHMRAQGVPADKLHCVLNGVPALPEDAAGARRRRQPLEPFVVAMVALFRPRKGAEVLLDAIAQLREREHDVRLEAVGPFETPEYEAELRERVRQLGLLDAVRWRGFTDNVQGELAKADALALPSLFGEGLPMVVLEAMAAGLPVVATRCEGTTEAILHGETGYVVEPGSVRQIADSLENLLTGPVDYPAMSLAARRRHADRFSDRAMARQVAAVYDTVLGRSGR